MLVLWRAPAFVVLKCFSFNSFWCGERKSRCRQDLLFGEMYHNLPLIGSFRLVSKWKMLLYTYNIIIKFLGTRTWHERRRVYLDDDDCESAYIACVCIKLRSWCGVSLRLKLSIFYFIARQCQGMHDVIFKLCTQSVWHAQTTHEWFILICALCNCTLFGKSEIF